MRNRHNGYNHQEVALISFRDLTTSTIGMLIGIIIWLILMVNPAAKKAEAEAQKATGNIRIEVIWPKESDADIDLWCKAPGDVPVGYSNKSGLIMNLVRDDLGKYMDITDMNYEVIFSRGNPPGEYICNVHWYANRAHEQSVPVKMIVTYNRDNNINDPITTRVADTVLRVLGEEQTMIRWTLDQNRKLVPSSVNSIQKNLRKKEAQ